MPKDEALLKEIRENFKYFSSYWKDNYEAGDKDIKALTSEYGPWPDAEVTARKDLKRPVHHVDILSQYNRRIINQMRMNKRGIKINPKGEKATEQTAMKREDRIRQIEYECNAEYARQWAAQNAVDRGIGYYKVRTDYIRPDSFDQKIIISRIPNPKSVLMDPGCKEADRSDAKRAFEIDSFERGEFLSRWDESQLLDFDAEDLKIAGEWITEQKVLVASYWRVEMKKRTLLRLKSPEGLTQHFLDELQGAKVKKDMLVWDGGEIPIDNQRVSQFPKVMQYITNGMEILDKESWMGSTIPIIMVTGNERFDESGKLIIESATRKGIPGQLWYDFAITNELETLGMVSKSKWVVIAEQIEGFDEWQEANRNPTAALRYRAKTDATGDNILPPPQRTDFEPPIQALEIAQRSALMATENAMGMSSQQYERQAAKSGKTIEKLDQAKDVSSFHFADNARRAMMYEGRIINELLDKIEDTDTVRGFRSADDKYTTERVTPQADENGEVVEHPYGEGSEHDVTVTDGPQYQSKWEENKEIIAKLIDNPIFGPKVPDLLIHTLQLGPVGDEIEKRVKPPGVDGPQQLPPEVQQKMAMDAKVIDGLIEKVKEAEKAVSTKQAELDAKLQIAQADNATEIIIQRMKNDLSLQIEQIGLEVKQLDQYFESSMQGQQRQHESGMQAGQQDHQAGLQAGQQEHQAGLQDQQLTVQQEQAALAAEQAAQVQE